MILFQSAEPERENDMLNNNVCEFVNGVYLQGQIEAKIGYDCVVSPNNFKDLKEGIYTVIVFDGIEPISCTLYFWRNDGIVEKRGLIVEKGDFNNNLYAKNLYEKKAAHL